MACADKDARTTPDHTASALPTPVAALDKAAAAFPEEVRKAAVLASLPLPSLAGLTATTEPALKLVLWPHG